MRRRLSKPAKVERRKNRFGRRSSDRKWPRILRDFWLAIVSFLMLLAINAATNQQKIVCNSSNQLRMQLNQRTQLTAVAINHKEYLLPIASADLLKLSAALTQTRQEESQAFSVFLILTVKSIKQQSATLKQDPELIKSYLKNLKTLIGDYDIAAKLDSQVRDSLANSHYEQFPLLDCSTL